MASIDSVADGAHRLFHGRRRYRAETIALAERLAFSFFQFCLP
jgi:hypothetical protein